MARFEAFDGVGIAYEVAGEGPAVMLLHGFASSARINWERPGVAGALVDAGFRVVTFDARGHGASDKPHDPRAYGGTMVGDVRGLLDHLEITSVDLVGYSMGAQVAASTAAEEPRVRRLVLGGIGSRLLLARPGEERYPASAIAAALEADDAGAVAGATPRAFRAFADATGADRVALAALQRARVVSGHPDLAKLEMPVLVVVGEADTLVGDAAALVAALPHGRLEVVPGDHLSAVTTTAFALSVVSFLAR